MFRKPEKSDPLKSIQSKHPRIKNIQVSERLLRTEQMIDENTGDPFEINRTANKTKSN